MRNLGAAAGLSSLLLFTAAPAAHAAALYLAGAEVSEDADYLYLGRIAAIGQSQLQAGPAYRLWADRTKYQYDANGLTHRATAYGVEAGLGRLFQPTAQLGGSAFASLVVRDTRLSPDDPGSDARGSDLTLKLQGDLDYRPGSGLSANFGASYVLLNDAYWTRLRLLRALAGTTAFGIELIHQGDASYKLNQGGLVYAGWKAGGVGIDFKAGVRKVRGESSAPYLGVELGASY